MTRGETCLPALKPPHASPIQADRTEKPLSTPAETPDPRPQGRATSFMLPWASMTEARGYYEDAELHSIYSRAMAYVGAGVPVRFQGPAGTGKTTLALRVAQGIGRPVLFVTGHSRLTTDELVGREVGQSISRVDDKYIASVRRVETRTRADWADGALAAAMRKGHTLVYDEFTRAPPQMHAALLSVLEEGVLALNHPATGPQILRAHEKFRLLLTSNPADYRGVQNAPDALLDRLVTFELDAVSPATEAGIVASACGLPDASAARVVALLRALRRHAPQDMPVSLRTAILIGRLLRAGGIAADPQDPRFVQVCADVLRGRVATRDIEARIGELARTSMQPASSETDRADPSERPPASAMQDARLRA